MYYYKIGKIFNKEKSIIRTSEIEIPELKTMEISQKETEALYEKEKEYEFLSFQKQTKILDTKKIIFLLKTLIDRNIKISQEDYDIIINLLNEIKE